MSKNSNPSSLNIVDSNSDSENDIFQYMTNYFELGPENLHIKCPYSLNSANEILKNLTLDSFTMDLQEIVQKEFNHKIYSIEENFSLNNIKFFTSSMLKDDTVDFILLKNFIKEDFIIDSQNEKFIHDDNLNLETGMNINITTRDDDKKEINIKCIVNEEKFTKNIVENLIKKSQFEKAQKILENSKKYDQIKLDGYNYEFDIKIFSNSINKMFYTDKGELVFDLQFPPSFRTNFMIDDSETPPKLNKSNYTYYENIVFPFRNFQDEISNLKYRHFYILIQKNINKNEEENDENERDSFQELKNYLGSIFKDVNGIVDKKKFSHYANINLMTEIEYKQKHDFKIKNYELSDYFKYNSNKEIYESLKEQKFINESEEYCYYYDDEFSTENNTQKKRPIDEELIKLYYQIIVLISEGILSYYNAIEFTENILFQKNKDYRTEIFEKSQDRDYPTFFNITLTKLINRYQNSLEEKTLTFLENDLKNTFNRIYTEYLVKGMKEILKPSKNPILKNIQRCIITPTYILFTPYILDQGNRILREFLESTNLAMLCVLKMDNFEEGRWSNKFLIEYIKYILANGFFIGEKNFKFFNFSQSQFRNMSCWLLTNPKKILEKTGDYSKIKIVAKFGARISQTLTTTIRTIKIPNDHIIYINDIKKKSKIKDDKGIEREIEYIFSDGVGKISYDLAEKITEILHLKNGVPACFQGRFLGCKGVWTTMYDDNLGNIYIRPSQNKFSVKKNNNDDNYFELCDYSRYIQAYLNRQVILLMKAAGISDGIFMKKLFEYRNRLEDEKFVLSLVHYNEWNSLFNFMNNCGINRLNDRLMKSLIESNLEILYNDVKNKARIYIEDSAYVIGIMDEYNILEYGQAYLHIKRNNFEKILNQKCTIAKCPCLHPGDIRVLDFKKYIQNDENTLKYKIFDKYENVLIFPSKGKRPHPNECSGSDLDGDNYFVFYDKDLIVNEKNLSEPMNYTFF